MLFPLADDNPSRRFPIITAGIIAVNAATMLYVFRLPEQDQALFVVHRGFVPKRIAQFFDPKVEVEVELRDRQPVLPPRLGGVLIVKQKVIELPADRGLIALSLITSLFVHGGLVHLIGNMWFLWVFGNNIEESMGRLPFLFFYVFGGVLASSCHWLVEPGSTVPVIGASGAVASVLGAYAITFPFAQVRCLLFLFIFITIMEIPALLVLGLWFAEQLLEGIGASRIGLSGGVAWWAHVGGFVAGVLLAPWITWERRQTRRSSDFYTDGISPDRGQRRPWLDEDDRFS